jgi:hypothetical protein
VRDDVLIPSLSTPQQTYDDETLKRVFRDLELTLTNLRVKGPIDVSTVLADTLTAGAVAATTLTATTATLTTLTSTTANITTANITTANVTNLATPLIKEPVVAATTANITLSGEQTIDNVSVVSGDRVLVKDQSAASENGIYVVASGAWSRSSDADSDGDFIIGTLVLSNGGTVNDDIIFTQTESAPEIGTDDINFDWTNNAFEIYGYMSDWGSITVAVGEAIDYGSVP